MPSIDSQACSGQHLDTFIDHPTRSISQIPPPLAIMADTNAKRAEGIYGPGSYTDTGFVPVHQECRRLMRELAARTPGFTIDERMLDQVTFEGDDLPVIPGPIKSEAMTAVLQAMVGIVGQEILALRGLPPSPIRINTNQASMYCATPALPSVDGVDELQLLKKYLNPWDYL